MKKYVPYEKLSKKEKRKLDSALRGTWGSLNPVTRKSPNPRAYNRKKAQSWKSELRSVPFSYAVSSISVKIASIRQPAV